MYQKKNKKYIIDLFSGCGGFALGFKDSGYESYLAADIDEWSCKSFKNKFKETKVINEDITSKEFKTKLKKYINDIPIEGVVAGLPCQSFSSVGKAQDKYSMQRDKRNFFYKDFFECLEIIKPKFFVFENVRGILNSKPNGVNIFEEILNISKSLGYTTIQDKKKMLFDTSDYGVPQVRKRVFVIGVQKKYSSFIEKIYSDLINGSKESKKYTVKDAINDLPSLMPGQGLEKIELKKIKENKYLKKIRNSKYLYNHVARNHNTQDRQRYKFLSKNNWALRDLKKVRPDLIHHDPEHFHNRYTVQRYDQPGKTVVSHLYKDGNLFIHPDHKQERTFTVREAARIQSFPDNFVFEGSRTQQYKQIGNAVPPLMAEAIAKSIKKTLERIENV
jgi:DNA (cytosine-5)-methyltransferase 1